MVREKGRSPRGDTDLDETMPLGTVERAVGAPAFLGVKEELAVIPCPAGPSSRNDGGTQTFSDAEKPSVCRHQKTCPWKVAARVLQTERKGQAKARRLRKEEEPKRGKMSTCNGIV